LLCPGAIGFIDHRDIEEKASHHFKKASLLLKNVFKKTQFSEESSKIIEIFIKALEMSPKSLAILIKSSY
jgi:hypothetical protein